MPGNIIGFRSVMMAVAISLPSVACALSFSADAVQVRDGEFSHARMFWQGDKVRFEYVEDSVPMVQIFDNANNRIIWLDTEAKQYVERVAPADEMKESMLRKNKPLKNPCDVYSQAECTSLKKMKYKGRQAHKWLVTFKDGDEERHMFQWIDTKLGLVLKQKNPDGSSFSVDVLEDQELNERKVTKLVMHAVGATGLTMQGSQWIDRELGIIVRQENELGAMDELRNIKSEKLDASLFSIPASFSKFKSKARASDNKTASVSTVKD